jgi:hypothetical protein
VAASRLAALAFAILAAARADGRLASKPVLVRIDGHVGSKLASEPEGLAELTLRRGETTIAFHVREIRVLSGDLVGLDVLAEVAPYTPNMTVTGPRELLDRLAGSHSGQALVLTGYYRRGSRMLMLSAVEPAKGDHRSRSGSSRTAAARRSIDAARSAT